MSALRRTFGRMMLFLATVVVKESCRTKARWVFLGGVPAVPGFPSLIPDVGRAGCPRRPPATSLGFSGRSEMVGWPP